jgi:hypothetical protein
VKEGERHGDLDGETSDNASLLFTLQRGRDGESWLRRAVCYPPQMRTTSTVGTLGMSRRTILMRGWRNTGKTAGGFFASGFKRAFKIKDFGDSIPGHGGLTDRMDCQVVMAVFANIYYNTFVKLPVATVASLLQTVRRSLTLVTRHVGQPYTCLYVASSQPSLCPSPTFGL